MPSSRLSAGAPRPAALPARPCVALWHGFDRAFSSARTLDERRALAARLSAEPAPAAEAHALQADLLLRAWPLRPAASRLPPWRHLPLPGASRLAWARLALRVDPGCHRGLRDDEPALWASALEGLDLLAAPDPAAVLGALAGLGGEADRALRAALPAAIARGLLAPAAAQALLLGREDAWAWSTLGEPWASGLPLPLPALRRALQGEHAAAALRAAGARGLWGEVRFLLRGPAAGLGPDARPDRALQRAALGQAGRLGDREAVGAIFEAALGAPEELGDEALRALVVLHHRGHFVREGRADDALALLAAGARLPDDELAGLLFVARRAVIARLPRDADDPLWPVVAPLLARWRRAPRPPAGLVEALTWLARETRRPALLDAALGLLRALAVDVEGLDLRALEAAALCRLDDAPAAALALLEATAGDAARAELGRRLDVAGRGPADATLSPHAARALLVLWHATPPAERAPLLDALDPTRLPAELLPALCGDAFDERARSALELRRGADDPNQALLALCAVATPDDLHRLELGLARAIEQAALPEAATPAPRRYEAAYDPWLGATEAFPRYGEDAQQLARPVAEALDALEARWKPQHRHPVWLLAPGPRLRAELLVRAIEAGPPRAAELAALLRSLLELEHPRLRAAAARLLGHPDDDVAKLAARLLARDGAWLSLELARGASGDDRRARACVAALAAAGGPAAEAAALGLLERPTMNLKKAGAEALAALATPPSAPALVRWLGQHDDPGLRSALGRALDRALGEGRLPALLAALEGAEGDARRQALLVRELDGLVAPPLARAWLDRPAGWQRQFFAALAEGTLALRGADAAELGAELRSLGLHAPEAPPAAPRRPFDDAVGDLARLGWSPERAAVALARWPQGLAPAQLAALRRELPRWLDAMMAWREVRPASLLAAVLAAGPDASELAALREAAPGLGALLLALEPADRKELWPALEALVDRLEPLDRLDLGASLRAALGATPGLARSPLAALAACGLVLRRDDVERALAGVADVPDPRGLRRAILAEAFGVEGSTPAGLEPDGEGARLRALVDEAARENAAAWPARLDALEALRPVGVPGWSWPRPPEERRARPPEPRLPGGHAALLRQLEAWLQGSPPGPTPSGERLAEALPAEVVALAQDPRAVERLAAFLGSGATPALRRAYRPWLDEQAECATGRAREGVRAALAPPPREGIMATPRERERLRERWRALLTTPPEAPPLAPSEAAEVDREAWRREALGADAEASRRALTRLSRAPDGAWPPLALRAARHPSARVRAHALRLIRRTLDRAAYLAVARTFLRDDDATARRSAVRIVGHGGDAGALPELVALLLDPVRWVRDEALAAIGLYGEAGLAAIRHGVARARPDEARRLERAAAELGARPEAS